jgi:hypothetical protein
MRPAAAGIAMLVLATLSGCASAAAAPAPTAPVGHAELQLVGEWTGEPDARGDGVLGMSVTDAAEDGTAFEGELTFAASGSEFTESVVAAMTPHGHLVAEIGEDASVEVHIVDPATLDYCFIRYGTDPVHACGRLARGD